MTANLSNHSIMAGGNDQTSANRTRPFSFLYTKNTTINRYFSIFKSVQDEALGKWAFGASWHFLKELLREVLYCT